MTKILKIKIMKIIVMYINVLIMIVRMLKVIVRMLKMIVKVIVLKIVYVGVLMRLVSITPGHVKLDWLPPPKVDRINDNPAHYQH